MKRRCKSLKRNLLLSLTWPRSNKKSKRVHQGKQNLSLLKFLMEKLFLKEEVELQRWLPLLRLSPVDLYLKFKSHNLFSMGKNLKLWAILKKKRNLKARKSCLFLRLSLRRQFNPLLQKSLKNKIFRLKKNRKSSFPLSHQSHFLSQSLKLTTARNSLNNYSSPKSLNSKNPVKALAASLRSMVFSMTKMRRCQKKQ